MHESAFTRLFVLSQGPLVGVNPVQIRAAAELYPRSRPSLGGDIQLPETPTGYFFSVDCFF